MLCENCQHSVATVHLSGFRTVATGSGKEQRKECVEHHFCEACAGKMKTSNPLISPLLKVDSLARSVELKVVSVSADRVEVSVIKDNSDLSQDHWVFVTSRLPRHYAREGMEFEMILTDAQLKWLKGDA